MVYVPDAPWVGIGYDEYLRGEAPDREEEADYEAEEEEI